MYFQRQDKQSFWDFLNQISPHYQQSDFPFLTKDNPPRFKPIFDFGDYLKLSGRGEALSYLYQGLGKSLSYVGPALDSELTYGFNDHTDRHTLWVTNKTLELLHRSGSNYSQTGPIDVTTELLATLAAMTHDIGNLIGRKMHPIYSVEILEKLFVHESDHQKEWNTLIQAVQFHDEFQLTSHHFKLAKGSPLLWALVAADKMHVSRDRLGDKSALLGTNHSIEYDKHIVLNLLIARSTWYFQKNIFTWHLDFSCDIGEERLIPLANHKDRVWVPQEYQNNFRKLNQPYRETFTKNFLETYGDRIKLVEQTTKLLFPWLSGFQLILSDGDITKKVGAKDLVIYSTSYKLK